MDSDVIAFADGTQTDSAFIAPEGLPEQSTTPNGGAPTKTKHEIVVSSTLQDEGIKEGDTITIDRLEIPLKVVGFTDDQRTFGHVDAAYLPLDVWQEIHAGARKGEEISPEAYKEISVIATLLTGAFFLAWTIQRAGNIAALRAMGATKGFLLRDSLGQAVIILGASVIVGALIAVGLGSLLETTAMPYAAELGSVLSGSAILFVSGLIGALIAVVRVTRTNPLAALGDNR